MWQDDEIHSGSFQLLDTVSQTFPTLFFQQIYRPPVKPTVNDETAGGGSGRRSARWCLKDCCIGWNLNSEGKTINRGRNTTEEDTRLWTAELIDGSRTSLNHNSYLKILNGVHLFSLDRFRTATLNRYLYFYELMTSAASMSCKHNIAY